MPTSTAALRSALCLATLALVRLWTPPEASPTSPPGAAPLGPVGPATCPTASLPDDGACLPVPSASTGAELGSAEPATSTPR